MNTELLISILYGEGANERDYPQLVRDVGNLVLFKEASNPETFLALHKDKVPDIVLIDLDGQSRVPDWLAAFINRLPRSDIIVCSQCLDSEFLLRLLELRVHFIPLPLSRDNLETAVRRALLDREHVKPVPIKVSRIVAVAGSREGVGITSIATNLALALAEQVPENVILVDLSRPFPAVGQFLNLKEAHNIIDLVQGVEPLDPIFIGKILHRFKPNLSILLGNPDLTIDDSLLLAGNALDKVLKGLRSSFEWIVVDLGYWIDSLYLRIVREADVVLLLSELSVPHLQNIGRMKKLFHHHNLDSDKIKVVVNRYDKKSLLELKDLEKIFMRPIFYHLPSDYFAMADAINQGEPLSKIAPKSKLWRSIKDLAMEIVGMDKERVPAKPGLLQRLFSHKE